MDYTDLHPVPECRNGTEAEILCFALDRVHAQFAWKTGRLDAAQLRRRLPPSTMTLAGLIKHMSSVEECWIAGTQGRKPELPWDPDAVGAGWEWDSAVNDEPDALYALWYGVVDRSRIAWRQMSANGGLDTCLPSDFSRRRTLIDLLEEYLKHTGHADLLREAVDGLVGNDPVEVDDA